MFAKAIRTTLYVTLLSFSFVSISTAIEPASNTQINIKKSPDTVPVPAIIEKDRTITDAIFTGFYGDAYLTGHHGDEYLFGFGFEAQKDLNKAIECYLYAFEHGIREYQFKLDFISSKGKDALGDDNDLPKNQEEATKWWADHGEPSSQYMMGYNQYDNPKEAIRWYKLAAENGNTLAANSLGRVYSEGEKVPKDINEAIKWFKKAAENGDLYSQLNLGYLYYEGSDVPKDFKQADMSASSQQKTEVP
jgi:TPR repeat protein